MRKIAFMIIAFVVATMAMAAPITVQQARQRAQQFLAQRGAQGGLRLAKQQLKQQQAEAYYYVFNAPDQKGFVIVSGDDRTEEILGYSDNGEFSEKDLPDNMRAWLQGYEDQMRWMDEHHVQQAPRKAVKNIINPLLTTQWNQNEPFNNNCPIIPGTSSLRSVTGCVATAMAQVLAYQYFKNNLALSTIIPIPGYTCSTNWNGSGRITIAELPATSFDCANLLPDYKNGYNSNQAAAVAKLMQYCGASVEMEYGPSSTGGSSAGSTDVGPALRKYFNFDAAYESRNNYTYADWEDLIYAELAEGRPVYYSGNSSGSGHAFVVDGYDGEGLFHVNWGWGGKKDAYFVLSILNPGDNSGIGASSTNDGYSFSQAAVIGVKPATGTPQGAGNQLNFNFLAIDGTKINFEAINQTGETYDFDYGLGYISNGVITPIKAHTTNGLKNNWGFIAPNYDLTWDINGQIATNGTYRIVGISRVHTSNNSNPWLTTMADGDNYVEAVVSGGNTTLTLHPLVGFSTSVNFPGNKIVNEEQPVDFTLQNTADEFYGVLYFFASTSNTNKGSCRSKGGITVPSGANETINFSFTPTSTGTWHVWICTDEAGSNEVGYGTVTIANGTGATDNLTLNIACSIANTIAGQKILGKYMTATITFTNNNDQDYSGQYWPVFYTWTGNLAEGAGLQTSISIPAHESREITVTSSTEMEVGKEYSLCVEYVKNNAWTVAIPGNTRSEIYTAVETMTTFAADGTATLAEATSTVNAGSASALDLRGCNVTDVTASSNPNCIYLVDSDISSLNGCNVVKNGAATSINITDDNGHYPFYAPIAFTAENVSYTRTFDKYYAPGGNGWTTICLPFAATNVTAGGETVDWFRNSSDNNKNFWMMEFVNDGTNAVYFDHAATLQAYTPYIIAIPGDAYGAESLKDKQFVFSASNITVPENTKALSSGGSFKFYGTMAETASLSNAYFLNDEGNTFQKQSSGTEHPFRAYFTSAGSSSNSSLDIAFVDHSVSNAIANLKPAASRQSAAIYTLSGMKVSESFDRLPAGIYIVNGKKVIK